jgi:hypothetical protein
MSDRPYKPDLDRRNFLSLFPKACVGAAFIPLIDSSLASSAFAQDYKPANPTPPVCWLDVCAPFVVEDARAGIHSEIFLTSDTFIGRQGYEDSVDATEYEIYLYDAAGRALGSDGVAKRLSVPAMHTTVLPVSDLLSGRAEFWGGMKIRLRPKSREPMYTSDLFSSAFVRWKTKDSFDNLHANPDPLQWQRADSFFYSMPFPPLERYECAFSLFNPNRERSAGTITLYDPLGGKLRELPFDLPAHASLLLNLRRGEFTDAPAASFASGARTHHTQAPKMLTREGGSIGITNQPGTTKSFGYMLIKRADSSRFSAEHPIHQPPFRATPAPPPFDPDGGFKAKNILYTPLVFHAKQIGGVTIESRFHFSSGAPIEDYLWLKPLITDARGKISWQVNNDAALPPSIAPKQIERGAIKLGSFQNCIFDPSEIGLPKPFSGGLFLAVAPTTNHTLMKVELTVKEWGAHSFTHFRPGLQAARSYQKPKQRGGLTTDYIGCGARCEIARGKIVRDEIIAVINIDDKNIVGHPTLEVFASNGLVARISLGEVPGYACKHYLLSELLSEKIQPLDLSLRLVDEQATLLMSVVHLDYTRRDLALDHGSDRFSTFLDYPCESAK